MLFNIEDITISYRNTSKKVSETTLSHSCFTDLSGEVKTVFSRNSSASVQALIYDQSNVIFRENVVVEWEDYKVSGIPHKIAVTNAHDSLINKIKKIMHEVAVKRQVDAEEQETFAKMLANACKSFPNLTREQGMHLALNALKAKRRRQSPLIEDEAE
jgi:hypothetical protein